ncbi:hypothetical protein NDU88_012822 [Pleurodeles waltl]|uniref:Uncharacterized protein n=1 Tax=Pleurodeles waltl TaxID=8319 RepID=A0AAV7R5Q8_PLEWA|nr:hypothetical protein NDU88_012822 [Pleurodeles waltl]
MLLRGRKAVFVTGNWKDRRAESLAACPTVWEEDTVKKRRAALLIVSKAGIHSASGPGHMPPVPLKVSEFGVPCRIASGPEPSRASWTIALVPHEAAARKSRCSGSGFSGCPPQAGGLRQ